ncbi:MAG: hypothetical protein QXR54_01390 [Nanopusillaceae archaeon]
MNTKNILIKIVIYTVIIYITFNLIAPYLMAFMFFIPYNILSSLLSAILIVLLENIINK